jgi:maltooligosyltrehalose trehalohydrolase
MSSYEYSFGPQLLGPNRTRFRLWAPSKEKLSIEIEGLPPLPMQPRKDGWFEAEADCGAGARYRYRVSDDLAVPDPASRAQADDIHDPSVVVDPDAFQWQHPEWTGRPWHETVLYEFHVGAFGGFSGAIEHLPALAALGITAIELMPVADFPGARNWGYDGVLPYAPDAAYGTPVELKSLVDAAHGLGMMVFLDVVYNHFGPDGNYLSTYAAPFFRDDIDTPWGQAIDFRNRAVRDFFTENALYWLLEYRFDGLRFDAVHAISERDWLVEMAERIRATVPPERKVHLVLENDDNTAVLLERSPKRLYDAQWNDDGHHALHVLLTGEREGYYAGYIEEPAAKLARCLAEGFIYQGDAPLHPGGKLRGEPSRHLPPTSFVLFLQNHDQIGNRAFGERLTSLAHPHALRAANALLLLSPHIPLLFMGEEYGTKQPFLYFTSHQTQELADAVRQGRRQEFAKFKAFSDPSTREKIPDPNAEQAYLDSIPRFSVAPEDSDPAFAPWPEWTRELLAIRRDHIVPRLYGANAIGASAIGPAAVVARWRMNDGAVLSIALNLADTSAAIAEDIMPAPAKNTILFETKDAAASISTGKLPPYSLIAVLESANE